MLRKTLTGLLFAALLAAAAAQGADEVICRKAKLAFTPPSDAWRVNTNLISPCAALLDNKNLDGTIAINYYDYEIYGSKVDYGFLKDKLEKQEKNTFKNMKPNYERVSLEERKFAFGRAPRLEFSSYDERGYHRTAIFALGNGTIVVFCSAESLEAAWPQVNEALETLVASIRFTP